MKFRPCIDIHNGKVKQIVGSSLRDTGDRAEENYVAERSAAEFADLFKRDGLTGGHMILLNSRDSEFYEASRTQALGALKAYPGGLQVGGGVTCENAEDWIRAGASHVIVTSYVFRDGRIDRGHLKALERAVGKEHLVLDLSCRQKEPGKDGDAGGGSYYIMTDRWQRYTDTPLTSDLMEEMAEHCDEFLVHGIAVEGKESGIDEELVRLIGTFASKEGFPVTYAGGIRSLEDIRRIGRLGEGSVDFTVGSALDLYGGSLSYRKLAGLSGARTRAEG